MRKKGSCWEPNKHENHDRSSNNFIVDAEDRLAKPLLAVYLLLPFGMSCQDLTGTWLVPRSYPVHYQTVNMAEDYKAQKVNRRYISYGGILDRSPTSIFRWLFRENNRGIEGPWRTFYRLKTEVNSTFDIRHSLHRKQQSQKQEAQSGPEFCRLDEQNIFHVFPRWTRNNLSRLWWINSEFSLVKDATFMSIMIRIHKYAG